jgi:MFS family permease
MSRFSRLLGFKDPSPNVGRLASTVILWGSTASIAFQISTTFWMISIATALGGGDYILGMGMVGFLVIVRIAVQTLLDYPTGGIGDLIGQRWIMAGAMVCYAIAFWLTSTATIATPFIIFVIIYALMGLAASQESGAVAAWFDNNYRIVMPQDKDRKQYGVFWSRAGMVFQLVSTLILIPGSIFALMFSEALLFQVQAVFFIALAIIALVLVRDLPGARKQKSERGGFREYGRLLKDGIKFVGSSRFVTLTLMGEMLMWAIGIVWWEILLFPLYFGYLLSNVAVATFRTSMFAPMVVSQERSGVVSQRFEPKKWIPRFRLIQFGSMAFFMLLVAITAVFPQPAAAAAFITVYIPFTAAPFMTLPLASIVPVILIWVLFVSGDTLGRISGVLTGRIMIDVYPNRIRNCMYSLQPTIAMMLSIPFIILLSQLLAFLPFLKFPIVFTIAAGVAFAGAMLIRQGFKHPIPRDESIEEVIGEVSDEVPKVPEVEVPEIPIPAEIPAQTASELPAEIPSDVTSTPHEEFKEPLK